MLWRICENELIPILGKRVGELICSPVPRLSSRDSFGPALVFCASPPPAPLSGGEGGDGEGRLCGVDYRRVLRLAGGLGL